MSIYAQGLMPAAVNHVALTPLSFIERTAAVYGDYPAVIHGAIPVSYTHLTLPTKRNV